MKRIISFVITLLITFSCLTCSVFAANPPVTVVKMPNRAAVIDGKIGTGEWEGTTAFTLNPTDPLTWEFGFLGNILPPASHTNEDFSNTIRLMIKNGYLYYFEERIDTTPFYGSNDIRKSYCQDGTLIWFINTNSTMHSISVFATNKGSAPFMMFNKNDDQAGGTLLNCEIVSDIRDNGFLIEAKISLSDLLLTEKDFINGKMMTTYCCVNIYNSSFSGNSEDLWGDYGYEPWYTGVTKWMSSPKIQVVGITPATSSPTAQSNTSASSAIGSTSSVISSPDQSATTEQQQSDNEATGIFVPFDDDNSSNAGGIRMWIYIIIAAVVIIAMATVFYILKAKSKRKTE